MLSQNSLRRKPLVYGETNKDDANKSENTTNVPPTRPNQQLTLRSSKSLQRITLNNAYMSIPYQNIKREFSSKSNRENIIYAHRPSIVNLSGQGLDNANEDRKKKEDDPRKENVTKGVLSQRTINPNVYNDVYSRRIYGNAIRSTVSDIPWTEYAKNRRLIYELNPENPSSYMKNGRMSKENSNDKVCTFYQSFESQEPVLRIVISELRFRDMNDFLDEVSKLVGLRARERFVHTPRGDIVKNISEFEDFGVYFFGPAYIYDLSRYDRFRMQHTPDLIDSDFESEAKMGPLKDSQYYSRGRRTRRINIESNTSPSRNISLIIDELHHQSIESLLQECSVILNIPGGRVEKICTRRGRMVTSISEFFYGQEEDYIAVISFKSTANEEPFINSQRNETFKDPMRGSYDPSKQRRTSIDFLLSENQKKNETSKIKSQTDRDDFYGDSRLYKKVSMQIGEKTISFDPPSYNLYNSKPVNSLLDHMELEWIYGYNGRNCRNNIFILPSEEVVYFVAKIVVMYNMTLKKQRFYAEHTEEIRCIAQHPNAWIFATGQIYGGVAGHIRIWDSKLLFTRNIIKFDDMLLSVECLAFSQGDHGTYLATITTSGQEWNLHVVQEPVPDSDEIGDLEELNIVSSDPYNEIELALMFDPSDSNTLISCGKNHVFFWSILSDRPQYETGHFVGYQIPDYVTCIGFNQKNELITADSNGFLHLWIKGERRTNTIIKTSHTGSIIAMQVLSGGLVITGGGSDRMFTLVDCDSVIPTLGEVQLSARYGGIVAIIPDKYAFIGSDIGNLPLILGTSTNNLLIGNLKSEFECLLRGPCDMNTVITKHPNEQSFLMGGSDGNISLWKLDDHTEVWDSNISACCCAAAFHPYAEVLAIGTTSGRWIILDAQNALHLASFQTERSTISCLSFSPDGKFIAVGNEMGKIFVYQCLDDGKTYRYLSCTQKNLDSAILSVDWTDNGLFFRFTTSSAIDYFNVEQRSYERRRVKIRDLKFATQSGVISYETMGIWRCLDPKTTYTSGCKSKSGEMFLAGTSDGNIRMFNFPCDSLMPLFNEVNIHSGALKQVLFTSYDSRIVSVGQQDYCIAQWKLVSDKNVVEKSDSIKSEIVPNKNKQPIYDLQDQKPNLLDQKKEKNPKVPQKPKEKPRDTRPNRHNKRNPLKNSKDYEDKKDEQNSLGNDKNIPSSVVSSKENPTKSTAQKDDPKNSKMSSKSSVEYVMKLADD
ncbi:echinoderm microtubule-associated protein-like 1 isoform X1 [Hydra vulgaris]|uniref:Echinoderm microtubule-associated protein-like 1 isoform X1 n=1 Tax=Hydra vulgaris TaxID=6087 RepID=A0ABM4BRP9_HYDVU